MTWNFGLIRSISRLHGPRLRLGRRRRAAVGVARRLRRRALVVVAEVLVEVAVRVDAVVAGDLAVAVVVAQVLPPQPLVVERVLVAVRVRDRHEPQLGALEQSLDGLVVRAPSVDEVVQQPPVDLDRDPLAGVLGGAVEDRRRVPSGTCWPLRDLQRDDLAPLVVWPSTSSLTSSGCRCATAYSSSRMPPGSSHERQTV